MSSLASSAGSAVAGEFGHYSDGWADMPGATVYAGGGGV
jgi:hypothetical protein